VLALLEMYGLGGNVVFAESLGHFEGSWALGALVHRLLVEPPQLAFLAEDSK